VRKLVHLDDRFGHVNVMNQSTAALPSRWHTSSIAEAMRDWSDIRREGRSPDDITASHAIEERRKHFRC
jgi:hypothetical protein